MNRLSVFYEHIAEAARQTGLPLDAVCAKVKGFGFDAVELDAKRLFTECETLLPRLWDAGLDVSCLYYFFDFGSAGRKRRAYSTSARRQSAISCSPSRAF